MGHSLIRSVISVKLEHSPDTTVQAVYLTASQPFNLALRNSLKIK